MPLANSASTAEHTNRELLRYDVDTLDDKLEYEKNRKHFFLSFALNLLSCSIA